MCSQRNFALISAVWTGCWFFAGAIHADDTLPKGFDPGRYQQLWERNPFTLVTPTSALAPPSPFSNLILVNWLHDKGKDILFVQNTDTNEVHKVTKDEGDNPDKLRLLEIVSNKNPSLIEAKLTDGKEEGTIKFRFDQPRTAQNQNIPGQNPVIQNGQMLPGNMVGGPRGRIPQLPNQVQNQNNPAVPPDTQQTHRRRMLPAPFQTPGQFQNPAQVPQQIPQQVPQPNPTPVEAPQNNGADDDDS